MDLELKVGPMLRPRLLYEYWGGVQPDCSAWFQRILKQAGGPAGAAAEIHSQPRRVYAAAPQQFPRFRFIHFGQPTQSRTGAQVIAPHTTTLGAASGDCYTGGRRFTPAPEAQ